MESDAGARRDHPAVVLRVGPAQVVAGAPLSVRGRDLQAGVHAQVLQRLLHRSQPRPGRACHGARRHRGTARVSDDGHPGGRRAGRKTGTGDEAEPAGSQRPQDLLPQADIARRDVRPCECGRAVRRKDPSQAGSGGTPGAVTAIEVAAALAGGAAARATARDARTSVAGAGSVLSDTSGLERVADAETAAAVAAHLARAALLAGAATRRADGRGVRHRAGETRARAVVAARTDAAGLAGRAAGGAEARGAGATREAVWPGRHAAAVVAANARRALVVGAARLSSGAAGGAGRARPDARATKADVAAAPRAAPLARAAAGLALAGHTSGAPTRARAGAARLSDGAAGAAAAARTRRAVGA